MAGRRETAYSLPRVDHARGADRIALSAAYVPRPRIRVPEITMHKLIVRDGQHEYLFDEVK